jgi:hypothetical protein
MPPGALLFGEHSHETATRGRAPGSRRERGHFADAVLVFAERELKSKSRALLVYGAKRRGDS